MHVSQACTTKALLSPRAHTRQEPIPWSVDTQADSAGSTKHQVTDAFTEVLPFERKSAPTCSQPLPQHRRAVRDAACLEIFPRNDIADPFRLYTGIVSRLLRFI